MRRYTGFIIVLLLIAFVFAPIDVPYTLESVCKAVPVQEWVLLKTPQGNITSTLKDHRTDKVINAGGFEFDRGDQVEIQFIEARTEGSFIDSSATVASIVSNKLDEQLIQLQNLLDIELANLKVLSTGQKSSFLKQLEEEINLAREDLKLRKKTLERSQQLHSQGLISLTELEAAENAYEESTASVKVAEESLNVGATGEKNELLSLSNSKIEALKREIGFLEKKQGKYIIKSPFSGTIRFESLPEGDRLVVADTSETLLLIPVRLRDSRYVKVGGNVEIQLVEKEYKIEATILEISDRVEVFNMEPVLVAKALITSGKEHMGNGMPQRCHLYLDKVRVSEFLKRSIRWW